MATLNTLRTKGGFIVSIVIGLSLLAFLLGDLTSGGGSMLGSRQSRVGEIAGTPVDYMEYAREVEHTTRISQLLGGTETLNEQQTDQARAMAWESLITRYSYRPGFDKLGVTTSEAEQQDMIGGVYTSPVLVQFFSDPQTGTFSPDYLAGFMTNKDADPNGPLIWDYLKEQMLTQRLFSKYLSLVTYGMMVTDPEVQQGLKAAHENFTVNYVALDYAAVPDSTIRLTDNQIRDYYNNHKAQFRQGETRGVEYVLFEMTPSQQDYADAAEHVQTLAEEFAAAEDAFAYAEANSQLRPDRRFVKADQIDPTYAGTILGGETYGPVLQADTYVMTRLGGQHTWPDTLGARHIVLMSGQESLADSIADGLRAGEVDFERAAALHSLDQQMPGGDMGRFAPEDIIPEIAEALMAHRMGETFVVESPLGLHVMQLTYKAAPVTKYRVASVTYAVEPGPATESAIYGQASAFLAKAAGSTANFNAAVDGSGGTLFKRAARIANTDRNVSGLQNSLEMVRWAYTEKKAGAVSQIMQVGGDYVVAALTDVRHAGIAPVEQAAQAIRSALIRDEKAKQLAARMQGTSLAGIASAVGAQVDTAQNVQLNGFYIDGAGVEPQLIGAICASKQGALSKPVQGMSGVYVFEVTEQINVDNDVTAESERVRLEAMTGSYIGERINQALIEASDIEDMRVKFF